VVPSPVSSSPVTGSVGAASVVVAVFLAPAAVFRVRAAVFLVRAAVFLVPAAGG